MNKQTKSELAFIFSQLRQDNFLKIPSDLKQEVLNGYDEDIFNKFDYSKPFTEQNISEKALKIIYEIFEESK